MDPLFLLLKYNIYLAFSTKIVEMMLSMRDKRRTREERAMDIGRLSFAKIDNGFSKHLIWERSWSSLLNDD